MLAQVERTRNTRTLKNGGLPTCADSQTDANYFFWAAGVATLGTGLLPIKLNFLVNIGAIDLFNWTWRAPRLSFRLSTWHDSVWV
jgi:hypothetical protein